MKKISIIGVGFMGGSLALALKKAYPGIPLWGYARSKKSFDKLNRLKIVDIVSDNLKDSVIDSDMVILAAPVFTIVDYFKKIARFLKKGALIIDLGSTKALIEKEAKKSLPAYVSFVGCHPLCGSNKHGPENAVKGLYKGALCIITSRSKSARIVAEMWEKIGCTVHFMGASLHDKALSYVSHLPHIMSYSLSLLVPKEYSYFASSSFNDAARVSSSPPDTWADIFLSNKTYIMKNIDEYVKVLKLFKSLIKSNDRKSIVKLISRINLKHKKVS